MFNEDIFDDLFKLEEGETIEGRIEQNKKEYEKCQKQCEIQRELFFSFARTLPGAEKEREDNQIVRIEGSTETGEVRTITEEDAKEELLNFLNSIFSFEKQEEEEQNTLRVHL